MAYPKWLFRIMRDREVPQEIREVVHAEYRRLMEEAAVARQARIEAVHAAASAHNFT
jgi:uncharacterized protein (UPF0147 family)